MEEYRQTGNVESKNHLAEVIVPTYVHPVKENTLEV